MMRARSSSPYSSLFSRLVANTASSEDSGGCWEWVGKSKCRYGYARLTVYIPALKKNVYLSAHLVSYVLSEVGREASPDELYLSYLELRYSGLELDHTCGNTSCINPDHLDPCTHAENIARVHVRAARRAKDTQTQELFSEDVVELENLC